MIEKKSIREYLAPGSTGMISGELVVSKAFKNDADTCQYTCAKCAILKLGICFDKATKKRKKTCPACFGNDVENLSRKPLFFKEV